MPARPQIHSMPYVTFSQNSRIWSRAGCLGGQREPLIDRVESPARMPRVGAKPDVDLPESRKRSSKSSNRVAVSSFPIVFISVASLSRVHL